MGIKVLELPQNERYLVSDLEPSRHFVIKVSIAQAYKIDKILKFPLEEASDIKKYAIISFKN